MRREGRGEVDETAKGLWAESTVAERRTLLVVPAAIVALLVMACAHAGGITGAVGE